MTPKQAWPQASHQLNPALGRPWVLGLRGGRVGLRQCCLHFILRNSVSSATLAISSTDWILFEKPHVGTFKEWINLASEFSRHNPLHKGRAYHNLLRIKPSKTILRWKKRSERRKRCARAGCSKFGHRPPAGPPVANTRVTDRTDNNTLRR